jgi:hypothetical protein
MTHKECLLRENVKLVFRGKHRNSRNNPLYTHGIFAICEGKIRAEFFIWFYEASKSPRARLQSERI